MKKFLVRIRSVQEAKEFVQICEQINGDVNLTLPMPKGRGFLLPTEVIG